MLKLNEHSVDAALHTEGESKRAFGLETGVLKAPRSLSKRFSYPAGTHALQEPFPLRVLHVVNRLDTGGTEHALMNLIGGMSGELFEHRLCVTRWFNSESEFAKRLPKEPYVAGFADAGAQFLVPRLVRIIREYRPHIVHSRNWGAIEAILAARIARVPVTIHSEHGYELDMATGLPVRQRLFRRAVYSLADVVFTVTEELRDYHAAEASIAPDRIRVVRNGVDTFRFSPSPQTRNSLREKLSLAPESFVAGSVGRMVRIKDYATLLKAAELACAKGVDVRLLLAGAGPELETLRKQADETSGLAERVLFVGGAQNVPDLLNAMDVFVLPSILEGMSNTILEAMASGLPVLATRVGGNPELVADGECGWLFPVGDAAELAGRLEQLARHEDLRCAFGAEARRRAESRFSLCEMIGNYEELYLELAERRKVIGSREN